MAPKRIRSESYYANNRVKNLSRYHEVYKQSPNHRRNAYRYTIFYKYGLSEDDYDRLYTEQQGLCLICSAAIRNGFEDGAKLTAAHVDHCHDTGRVRGLLCHFCNCGLGNFKDNRDTLVKAIEYLDARSS